MQITRGFSANAKIQSFHFPLINVSPDFNADLSPPPYIDKIVKWKRKIPRK